MRDNIILTKSFQFSLEIVDLYKNLSIKKEYVLSKQLLKSGTSIGANIIEAKSGNSRKNLISFYSIALRSANETKYWLCLVRDTLEVDKGEVNNLIKEADEISKIIGKSILTLKQNEKA